MTPAPVPTEDWVGADLIGPSVGPGCLGSGTADKPQLLFGDASGGPRSRFPSLRRVGLGLVVMADPVSLNSGPKLGGSLTRRLQTVPRGELRCLEMASR
eukprot:2039166-Pyramimonas_sp.AAC.1